MNEILLVLLFALLLYGGRLPEVARSLGRGIATLRRNLHETTASVTRELDANIAVDVDVDVDGAAETPAPKRPRTVRRVAPAELAREDVSGTAPANVGGDVRGDAPRPAEPPSSTPAS